MIAAGWRITPVRPFPFQASAQRAVVLTLGLGLLLCGCARSYVMKLNRGMSITTASKPKLKHGIYFFIDSAGKENWVPQGRVVEIEPASMARKEQSPFRGPPAQ